MVTKSKPKEKISHIEPTIIHMKYLMQKTGQIEDKLDSLDVLNKPNFRSNKALLLGVRPPLRKYDASFIHYTNIVKITFFHFLFYFEDTYFTSSQDFIIPFLSFPLALDLVLILLPQIVSLSTNKAVLTTLYTGSYYS